MGRLEKIKASKGNIFIYLSIYLFIYFITTIIFYKLVKSIEKAIRQNPSFPIQCIQVKTDCNSSL